MSSHVEAEVQRRIAAARRRVEEEARRRAELAAARNKGLGFRHAAKLRRLAESVFDNSSPAASGA